MAEDKEPGDLIRKDPHSDVPYWFDWTLYLAELGPNAEIETYEIIISGNEGSPVALTYHDDDAVDDNRQVLAFYAAGTNEKRYRVTNRITTNTNPPVTDDRSVWMLVTPL